MKPLAIGVWTPRLRAASDRVRAGSSRVAVWAQKRAAGKSERAHGFEPANPIYLLAAITLGIPILLVGVLIGTSPGIQEGAFRNLVTFFAVSAFVVAAVFEIKRLADEPSETSH